MAALGELKSYRVPFEITQSRYNFPINIEGVSVISGYSSRYPKTFSPQVYALGATLDNEGNRRGHIEWDTVNFAQGSSFEDTFDRPDGPVANGWTTYKRAAATNQIESNVIVMRTPAAPPAIWGNLDYNLNVRPSCAGPGGVVVNGSDDRPLHLYTRVTWNNDNVVNYPGFCGVFFYWDVDPLGRSFAGASVGRAWGGVPGVYASACNGLEGGWFGSQIDAVIAAKNVFLRVVLTTNNIHWDYSLSGAMDDWRPHPSSPMPRVAATYNLSGAPSHFIIGRGYADQWSTGTYLRNVYMRM